MGFTYSDPKYGDCPTCGAIFVTLATHRCPPSFRVWFTGGEECDARSVHAFDADAAAVEFCDRYDSAGDYDIIRSGEADLLVRAPDGEVTRWSIIAESRPHYSAWSHDEPVPAPSTSDGEG